MMTKNLFKKVENIFYKLTPPFYIAALMFGFITAASIIMTPYITKTTSDFAKAEENKSAKLDEISKQIVSIKHKNNLQRELILTSLALKESNAKTLTNMQRYNLAEIIVEQADIYDIDPVLIVAQIQVESSFNKNALSNKGAKGLMQLLPGTAEYIMKKTDLDLKSAANLYDVETNITLGTAYMAYLIDKTNGNIEYALTAYNIGPANMSKAIRKNKIPTTYSNKVLTLYNKMLANINSTDMAQN